MVGLITPFVGYLFRATGSTLGCLFPFRRNITLFRLYTNG